MGADDPAPMPWYAPVVVDVAAALVRLGPYGVLVAAFLLVSYSPVASGMVGIAGALAEREAIASFWLFIALIIGGALSTVLLVGVVRRSSRLLVEKTKRNDYLEQRLHDLEAGPGVLPAHDVLALPGLTPEEE